MSKQTKVELTKVLVVIETIIAFVITMLINQTIAIALFVMMTIVVCLTGNDNINESESKEEEIQQSLFLFANFIHVFFLTKRHTSHRIAIERRWL